MSCRHDAPSTYREWARELAEQVDQLCIQRIERNRRIDELEEALRQVVAAGTHRDTYSPDTPEFSREAEIARAVLAVGEDAA